MKRKTANPKKLRRLERLQCARGNHRCEQQRAIRKWKAGNIRLGLAEQNEAFDRLNAEKGIAPCGPVRSCDPRELYEEGREHNSREIARLRAGGMRTVPEMGLQITYTTPTGRRSRSFGRDARSLAAIAALLGGGSFR